MSIFVYDIQFAIMANPNAHSTVLTFLQDIMRISETGGSVRNAESIRRCHAIHLCNNTSLDIHYLIDEWVTRYFDASQLSSAYDLSYQLSDREDFDQSHADKLIAFMSQIDEDVRKRVPRGTIGEILDRNARLSNLKNSLNSACTVNRHRRLVSSLETSRICLAKHCSRKTKQDENIHSVELLALLTSETVSPNDKGEILKEVSTLLHDESDNIVCDALDHGMPCSILLRMHGELHISRTMEEHILNSPTVSKTLIEDHPLFRDLYTQGHFVPVDTYECQSNPRLVSYNDILKEFELGNGSILTASVLRNPNLPFMVALEIFRNNNSLRSLYNLCSNPFTHEVSCR